jgi:hypothetical protein
MRFASITLAILMYAATAHAQKTEAHDKDEAAEAAKNAPALAAALKDAKVSLVDGLKASEKTGTPISAKFEIEDGKLQLSVYTMKGDKFSEVVVDHKTGKVAKTEAITSGEDLAAAKKQAAAMTKTKRSLRDLVTKAEKSNAGFKAVSVEAEIEDGKPQADINLLKGTEAKHVEDQL